MQRQKVCTRKLFVSICEVFLETFRSQDSQIMRGAAINVLSRHLPSVNSKKKKRKGKGVETTPAHSVVSSFGHNGQTDSYL